MAGDARAGLERSAVNSFTVAGAFVGFTLGLAIANATLGSDDPAALFTLAGLVSTPFTASAYLLVARLFRRGSARLRVVLAVAGWFVLLASIALLLVATGALFPRA